MSRNDCYECGSEWREDFENSLYLVKVIQNGEVQMEEHYCGNCLTTARIYMWDFMPSHLPDWLECEIRIEKTDEI